MAPYGENISRKCSFWASYGTLKTNSLLGGCAFSFWLLSFPSGSVEKYLTETGDHDEETAWVKEGLWSLAARLSVREVCSRNEDSELRGWSLMSFASADMRAWYRILSWRVTRDDFQGYSTSPFDTLPRSRALWAGSRTRYFIRGSFARISAQKD